LLYHWHNTNFVAGGGDGGGDGDGDGDGDGGGGGGDDAVDVTFPPPSSTSCIVVMNVL
jgi:hypothetical protein